MCFFDRIDREGFVGLTAREGYFWLDITDPDEEEIAAQNEVFGFHPLALEDALKSGQRSKLDDLAPTLSLGYYGAEQAEHGGVDLIKVHAFLSGGCIVTTHARKCAALEEVCKRLTAQPPRLEQLASNFLAALLHRRLLRPELQWLVVNIQSTGVFFVLDRQPRAVGAGAAWPGFGAPTTSEPWKAPVVNPCRGVLVS